MVVALDDLSNDLLVSGMRQVRGDIEQRVER